MFYQALTELIGDVPAGFEPVLYVVSAIVFIILLLSALNLIGSVFKFISGR